MAPAVCTAQRLQILFVSLFILFLNTIRGGGSALLVYNRQSLFAIRIQHEVFLKQFDRGDQFDPPPFLSAVPACLWRHPCTQLQKKKQSRKRGKRGGVLVRMRARLRSVPGSTWMASSGSPPVDSLICARRVFPRDAAVERRCAPVGEPGVYRPRRRPGRGVDSRNLRPLARAPSTRIEEDASLRLALFNIRSLTNKTFALSDFFGARDLDCLFLTETWLRAGECFAFSELVPPECTFLSTPRSTGRGGGLASVFKTSLNCHKIFHEQLNSFELQLFELKLEVTVLCALIYRPPKANKDFIKEFSHFVSDIALKWDRFLIVGDFNLHVCCPSKPLVKEFLNILDSFSLTQLVNEPTHNKGHILDLVLSYGINIIIEDICELGLSDHKAVLFSLSVPKNREKSCATEHQRRAITPATGPRFSNAFNALTLSISPPFHVDIDELINLFDSTCTTILDDIAPVTRKCSKPGEPWLNETTRSVRRECRQAERKWNKDKLHVSLEIYKNCLMKYQNAVKAAKTQYMSNLVESNYDKPQILFSVLNRVVNPSEHTSILPCVALCDKFCKFFIDKVSSIRAHISSDAPDPSIVSVCSSKFETFDLVSLSELTQIVKNIKTSNCPLDSLPTRVFKDVFDSIGPFIVKVINKSLTLGYVPTLLKQAIVQPLLKKQSLDSSVLSNYRPVSKLPFLSKVLEKVVFTQLQMHLKSNDVFEKFQSGFKTLHSTETALLKILNDLLLISDSGSPSVLVLLDLTAAFDTVDHKILLSRLESYAGIKGIALKWFQSYMSERYFSVNLGSFYSKKAPLISGVPQGSILGPLLFSLYMLPLGSIFRKYNMSFHCFADDVQIYLPLSPQPDAIKSLRKCLDEIRNWMSLNFLNLNDKKTEIVLFGDCQDLKNSFDEFSSYCSPVVKSLGVFIDKDFNFDKQISSVVKTSFFQLRLLSKVKSYLPVNQMEKVIHALISSRLDYCNSLYFGLNKSALHRLQLVQNAAARLLTGKRRRDHISPVLFTLHWLPVAFRIQFKILLFVYKALNNLAPPYLCELLVLHTPCRALRSADQLTLDCPRSRLKSRGDRAFSVAGPKLWNSLPSNIRAATSVDSFKSLLKTYLFGLAFNPS